MPSSSSVVLLPRTTTRLLSRSTRDHLVKLSFELSDLKFCSEGEWHQERLCNDKEFLKEAQQNYQSYQGVWVGKLISNDSIIWLSFTKTIPGPTAWVSSVTTGLTCWQDQTQSGGLTTSGPVLSPVRVINGYYLAIVYHLICSPGNSLICGFETKGHTAFPDNSEIDRVKFYCCDPDYQPEQ